MSEETRHDYLGHTVLLGLKKFIYPFGWGPPLTGVHGGYDFPTMAHQADKAHANGAVVAWSHLPHPHAELPIDVALGKSMQWRRLFSETLSKITQCVSTWANSHLKP